MSNLKRLSHRTILYQTRKTKDRYPKRPSVEHVYCIEAEEEYSLPYSLLSSYACYLFEPVTKNQMVNPYQWRGLVHPFIGLNLIQTAPKTLYLYSRTPFSPTIAEYVQDAVGLWNTQIVSSPSADIAKLQELYLGLRVPRLRENGLDVLIAILCSQHTKVSNGRRWFLFLKRYYRRIPPLLKMDPYKIMHESKMVSGGSMGYRARYIHEMLVDLSTNGRPPEEQLRKITEEGSAEKSRRKLINIRSVGPKTADCFLLNFLGDLSVPPIDVNVTRVCERLKLIPSGMGLPQLTYCRRFVCDSGAESCPYYLATKEVLTNDTNSHNGCVRAALKIKFEHAGWIQALLFLFGIEFCQPRLPLCDACSQKENCGGPELPERIRRWRGRRKDKALKKTWLEGESHPPLLQIYAEEKGQILELAREIFENSVKEKITGYEVDLMAASYWIAARHRGLPLTLTETALYFNIDQKRLFRKIEKIKRKLSIALPLIKPQDYVFPICKKLSLDTKIIERAKEIASLRDAQGHSPIGVAGAAVYLSTWENGEQSVTLKEISGVADVTTVTLRKKRDMLARKLKNQKIM